MNKGTKGLTASRKGFVKSAFIVFLFASMFFSVLYVSEVIGVNSYNILDKENDFTAYCHYECRENSDCGIDKFLNQRFCVDSGVFDKFISFKCSQDRGIHSSHSNFKCSNSTAEKKIEDCEFGCKNGECAGECSSNDLKNCAEGSSQLICVGNKVANISYVPGCENYSCVLNNINETIEECSFGCFEGKCEEEQEECKIDGDCGSGQLVNSFCNGSNLMSNYSNPDCEEGKCIVNFYSVLNQTCSYGCSDNRCNSPPGDCRINSDCGIIKEELVCKSGDSYKKITTPLCLDGKCFSNISYELKEECENDETCDDGKCKKEEEDDEEEEDIGLLLVSYCGDFICDEYRGENSFNCAIDCKAEVDEKNVPEEIRLEKKSSFGFDYSKLLLILLIISVLVLVLIVIYMLAGKN